MERKHYERYLKVAGRDTRFVDTAVSDGAFLSNEEWYDFMMKAIVTDQRFSNIRKYRMFGNDLYRIAEVEAYMFTKLCAMCVDGYTNKAVVKFVKSAVRKFNRILGISHSMDLYVDEEDGCPMFTLASCNGECIEGCVSDRQEIVNFCNDLFVFAIEELSELCLGSEMYVAEHLGNEIGVVAQNKTPNPYMGGDIKNTLRQNLMRDEDFCRKYKTAPNGSAKKVVGGGNVIAIHR